MRFPVTRQDAIWRQLDLAIDLWFREYDEISIHSLACSALQVARDVGKKFGKAGMLIEALPKDQRAEALAMQNFFKHADKDPHKVLSFNPLLTQWHIYDALTLYDTLYRGVTPLMAAFRMRFLLTHPAVGTTALPSGLPVGCDESALAKMSNGQFYRTVMPLLAGR